jgi:N-acetylglucosamine-6-phosphate deacetylase
VPGFIDIHVHGGGGFSLATRDPGEIEAHARWVVSHGVTSFLPTICAGGFEEGLEFMRTAARAAGSVNAGANVLGINSEGPFVNPERRGALPSAWISPPSAQGFERVVDAAEGQLRMMTLAPELPGAIEGLKQAITRGTKVSVGHTDAEYETACRAFDEGASHVTHAFNAMRPFHHRDPGPVLAAIDSPDVTLEVIADGVHLHPATVRWLVEAAGPGRVALITDAVPPAGLDSGVFQLAGQEAQLTEGRMLLPDGTIAGGAQTMDQIIRNVVEWQAADLPSAVRMASTVPARVLSLDDSKGRIAPGYDADLVALDPNLEVVATWVQGRLVYRRDL